MADRISEQTILEKVYDPTYKVLSEQGYGFDGVSLQRNLANNLQIYAVSSGGYDYFCFAAPGTALATAKWLIFRIDSATNLMYADANANFDNVATDPTALTYSYT